MDRSRTTEHEHATAAATDSSDRRAEAAPASPGDPRGRGVPLLRTPRLAPMAIIAGWLSAWGAAAIGVACLTSAGVGVGVGLGIADDPPGIETGFAAGLWLLIIQVGAFLVGGYVAARMARAATLRHGALAWLVAMLATGADALIASQRSGTSSVVRSLDIPSWADHGYANDQIIWPLAIFAVASLLAALLGAAAAGGVTRTERSPFQELRFGRRHAA